MREPDWRGYLNQILYGIIFDPDPDERAAARIAGMMIERVAYPASPATYAAAIKSILKFQGPFPGRIDTPHDDDRVRQFIRLLAVELERRRPEWAAA